MINYDKFIFDHYDFNKSTKILSLHYSLDDVIHFTETYKFELSSIESEDAALNQAFELLFLIAGVSYYKTYLPKQIEVKNAKINSAIAKFLEKTYRKGLGEFFYVNNLDPKTKIEFSVDTDHIKPAETKHNEGLLVALGGGKDSLLSVHLLGDHDVTTWSLNHKRQLEPLVDRVGKPHIWVDRVWDKKLSELKEQGAMNGHVPVSAIFAAVGNILAVMTGKQDVVVSNEASTSEAGINYQGVDINHQYSKSLEFEADWQKILHDLFGNKKRYYSLLRPYSELQISENFAKIFDNYKDVFSSCNRAYVHTSDRMFWCGECPKCAFTYLAFTPFLEQSKIKGLFNDKNLLLDIALKPTYDMLLGKGEHKPFDCVGTFEECKYAMNRAIHAIPRLKEIYGTQTSTYKVDQVWPDLIPNDIRKSVQNITYP